MQKRGMALLLLAALFAAALTAGCGGSAKEAQPAATGVVSFVTGTPIGMDNCIRCHTVVTADWMKSRHANAENGLSSVGSPTSGAMADTACKACHDRLVDSARLVAGYTGNVDRPVVGCEDCHGGGANHNGSGPVGFTTMNAAVIGGATSSLQVSAQFLTCSRCHELLDPNDPVSSPTLTAMHSAASGTIPTGSQYIITDTHFATSGNFSGGANVNNITGYAMDYSREEVCIDCHNPHGTADINRDWAQSKHADKSVAGAWAHYNWSQSTRRMCERCHTTTGYSNYADALRSGDMTQAELIRSGAVTMITETTGWKPEMLVCNGCHLDNRGTLRDPGPYTANYNYSTAGAEATASFSYPEASSSNVCIPCHSARQNGASVKNLVFSNPSVTNFSNLSFLNSHYLSAAGTLYGATGYEFPRSYANPATYKHDQIGTSAAPNTGSVGPCAGCHMHRTGSIANHLFRVVGKDGAGAVTSIVSEACYQCHAGSSSSLAAIVDQERVEYEDALYALIDQLDKKGISFHPSYPYMYQQRTRTGTVSVVTGTNGVTGSGTFFPSDGVTTSGYFRATVDGSAYKIASIVSGTQITLASNFTGPTSTVSDYVIIKKSVPGAMKNWSLGGSQEDGRNNLGAAFNLQLLEHEPGAYVHNSKYAKRLIYDSMDWIDDGALNNSVGAKLDALPAETSYKAGAMTYLLPSGPLWRGAYPDGYGVDSERP